MLENLQNAIRQNIAQRDLPEQVFIEAIEDALRAAAQRIYGRDADVSVEIDVEKGEIHCYVPKTVVNIMHDFSTEIPIEEAVKIQEDIELGQTVKVKIPPSEFGRIQAQLGRQVLFQRIKQAEREKVYQEFVGREGEIVTGYVQRFERGGIILDLEQTQTEAFLPPREIPRSQSYERGKRLQCLIISVKNEVRGAPVTVSRTHRDLVAMLFEQEVPEIYEGQVRIMAIERDPGNRAKVAVQATEEGIDATGTCVGVKGTRVQNISNELDGERIDVIEWSEDISAFIANALGRRAAVRRVELDDENKNARVIVPDDRLSLAIGQRGQNARLAARLTGWKVDIKGESEAAVSIDDLFKPEEPTSEKPDELSADTPSEGTDGNIEAQTPDTSKATDTEEVVVDVDDGFDLESDPEADIETHDATAEEDGFDLESDPEADIETPDATAEDDDFDFE